MGLKVNKICRLKKQLYIAEYIAWRFMLYVLIEEILILLD